MFGGGVAAGDYDGDGDVDLYVVRGNIGPNLLYRNDGGQPLHRRRRRGGRRPCRSGRRRLPAQRAGLRRRRRRRRPRPVRRRHGGRSLPAVSRTTATARSPTSPTPPGFKTMGAKNTISAAFGDYDLDGDLDMMLAHWGTPRPPDGSGGNGDTESLWRNDSDANGIRFTNVSVESGIAATIIARRGGYHEFQPDALDYDYTLHADFRAHGRGPLSRHPERRGLQQHARLHEQRRGRRHRDASATRRTTPCIIDRNGMGAAVGDIDNDGDLDWFVTGIFGSNETVGNRLYLNDGSGVLHGRDGRRRRRGRRLGLGRLLRGLQPRRPARHLPHQRLGVEPDRRLRERSQPAVHRAGRAACSSSTRPRARGMTDTEQGRGVVCADFDDDGDVDIFMTNRGLENSGAFWLNDDQESDNRSLSVRLVGARAEHRGGRGAHPRDASAASCRCARSRSATTSRRRTRPRRSSGSAAPRRPTRSRSSGRTAASTPTPTSQRRRRGLPPAVKP